MPNVVRVRGIRLISDFGHGRYHVHVPDAALLRRRGDWVYPLNPVHIDGQDVWMMLTGHVRDATWEAESVARLLTMATRYPLTWNEWLTRYSELAGLAREMGHPELAEPIG